VGLEEKDDNPAQAPSRPVFFTDAEYLGREFDTTRAACGATAQVTPGLHQLAHYSSGVFDFSVDALDEADALAGQPIAQARKDFQQLGRQLNFTVNTINRNIQEARTGELIRVVLHTSEGAVFCDAVQPGQYVVGLTIDRSTADRPDFSLASAEKVRTCDRALADLATTLRDQIRLSTQNHGGWSTSTDQPVYFEPSEPLISMGDGGAPYTERLLADCREATRPNDLQFVAYCAEGKVRFAVDHLGHPELRKYFTQVTVQARREFYLGFSHELGLQVGRLNRLVDIVPGGLLNRLVLDVEQGGVFYYRLSVGEYLIGVSLDQSRLVHADDRMSELAATCRALI
jgi:hypothetical protein